MEINTTHPNPSTLASQTAARDRKLSGVDDFVDSKKQTTPGAGTDRAETVVGDRLSLSRESVKLAQSTAVTSSEKSPAVVSREQAQQLLGQLVSDIQNDPQQALNAFGNRAGVNFAALLG